MGAPATRQSPCLTSGPTFVTLRPWKCTLSASDSGPTPRRAKSDFLSVQVQIPKKLAHVLGRDQALDGAVKLSIAQFEPWIKHSNLPFFPEYTKHDLDHIEGVLRTASELIADKAWFAITPADAAVLVLSALLHDCALHLSEDGFVSLLDPGRENVVKGMSDKPWPALWEEFFAEARRFDGRKLIRLFGDDRPVRRPPADPNDFTRRDRLLIGEFLRRHHSRLAHEIALYGVPTIGPKRLVLEVLTGSHDYIVGLAGVVARSHGENVRSYLPYLHDYFDERQFKGVHAVFLMTLLRVADYLQIESERAPAQVLKVKQLASPVSQGEWRAHHAIRDIRITHNDPEAIFIDALPDDVQTFFRIESWLRGIQDELDASWAVLGEVYGRQDEALRNLGLTLRRVRSSLDRPEEFATKVTYLPVRAVFRAADADLLKLLIEPLYGNRSEVGLRELIQNAVDAVLELEQYRKELPKKSRIAQPTQDSDVTVTIDKDSAGETWVTVSDKGIGMTVDVVVNYFLAAGASFRRSEEWRKMFETAEGKSKVLRAGRFGVGALASFLIGPEIEVSTRHADEPNGLQFKAAVDSDSIELRRVSRPVGTTIRIRSAAAFAQRLAKTAKQSVSRNYSAAESVDWDWYCLSAPSVSRTVFGKKLDQAFTLPRCGSDLPPDWRRISDSDYADILWTYSRVPYTRLQWHSSFGTIPLAAGCWSRLAGAVWTPHTECGRIRSRWSPSVESHTHWTCQTGLSL